MSQSTARDVTNVGAPNRVEEASCPPHRAFNTPCTLLPRCHLITCPQGRLVFDEHDPKMSSTQFVKLCQDLGLVQPNGEGAGVCDLE